MLHKLGLIFFFLHVALFAEARNRLAPKKFETLPLGSVRPAGWLYDQLQVQTDGLAGHMHEFYDLVSKSDWIGGDSYYSYLEEGLSSILYRQIALPNSHYFSRKLLVCLYLKTFQV
ncbi:hypothetical protein K435DRAFT_461450 [Dendrothele bispora CBS 962.96]|uniref:Uncharacterized protein n=1 Tax=Dendrothele bispora (strain CBS 962.96) TaxID=1314807 RepID=A0A4V4HGV2_DENBC|nr:hypothetical protein K435DRAFT_461450 [Dendrothele bispora CBS 962.96]